MISGELHYTTCNPKSNLNLSDNHQICPVSKPESRIKPDSFGRDALLQKTFCTDFLTKSYKVNEGEVPQYYVEHTVLKGFYKQLSSTAYLSNRVYDIMIKKSKCEV